jgi:DNA-binding GntR family transcriptional regulator
MKKEEIIELSLNIEDLKPLREKIASSIRDSIIEGKIKPGERLLEPVVAKYLGVSRTPLREAFLQLESEGFLKFNPRKGALVTETSLKDAEETYQIKGTLEALAAKLATEHLTENEIDEIHHLNEKMRLISISNNKDYKTFLELNSIFHQKIYERCGNDKLKKMIQTLRNQTLRYNFIFLSLMSHLEESVSEHSLIIQAIRNRNADDLEYYIKKHNESALKALREYIKMQ